MFHGVKTRTFTEKGRRKMKRTSSIIQTAALTLAITLAFGGISAVAQCETFTFYPPIFSFGQGGFATANVNPDMQTSDIAIQPDGKLVVVGVTAFTGARDFIVVRFNANGTLDTGFGNAGVAQIDFSGRVDSAEAVVIQPDGKIVVTGISVNDNDSTESDFATARLNANGSLDLSFGTGKIIFRNGKVRASIAILNRASDLALQPDGKIVIAGDTGSSFALIRYTSSGSLDTTFSGDGKASYGQGLPNAVLIQPDGKIVAAGTQSNGFGVLRVLANGVADSSFGVAGNAQIGFGSVGSSALANSVAIQQDGRLILGGIVFMPPANGKFAMTRLNANGTLDTTFGVNGKIVDQASPGIAQTSVVELRYVFDELFVVLSDTNNPSGYNLAKYSPATNCYHEYVGVFAGSFTPPLAAAFKDDLIFIAGDFGPGQPAIAAHEFDEPL